MHNDLCLSNIPHLIRPRMMRWVVYVTLLRAKREREMLVGFLLENLKERDHWKN